MDNMLYIIAGLVLILLVAGLALRKKKAQKPSVPPSVTSGKHTATQNPKTKTDYGTPTPNVTDSNKFDHTTIAQRFMDQQRYDKAIETINRGLTEKPNDSQLSLKLLSIYATIDQPENFHSVYETIKAHNDSNTLTQANELKGLYFEEQSPVVTQEMPVEDTTNFESIDFDLPTAPVNDKNAQPDQAFTENNNRTLVNESVDTPTFSNESNEAGSATKNLEDDDLTNDDLEDDFDLTLSDLESDFDEPVTTSSNSVTSLDISDDKSFETSTIDSTAATEDSDISDFDFSFDISEADNAPTEPSVTSNTADSAAETMALDHEEFILDFDDLTMDADDNTEKSIGEALTLDSTQSSEDDFTFSLEGFDESDNSNSTEIALENEKPILEQSRDIDNLVLEDSSFEDVHFEEEIDDDDLEGPSAEASSVTPTAPLLFDDNTLLDDDFEYGSSIATTPDTPVEIDTDTEANVETAEDFSARFSADFDFVKSLDSNQVTLDLAGQYLQLGEYDSAKRLLNEVMNRGNGEQQEQARLLLERTA